MKKRITVPPHRCQVDTNPPERGGFRPVRENDEKQRYVKIVEWSDEDQCFVGSCPGLFYGGCHGSDEKQVFAELCQIVDETIAQYIKNGDYLPPAGKDYDYANKMLHA